MIYPNISLLNHEAHLAHQQGHSCLLAPAMGQKEVCTSVLPQLYLIQGLT